MTVLKRTWISTPEAAAKAGVSEQAIRNWIQRYAIGRKVVGRMRVDPAALERLMDGELVNDDRPGE